MRISITLLVLALLPASAGAQQFFCGGHRITGGSMIYAAADVDHSALLQRPCWMTARDRELWDQLVYNAYDNHPSGGGDRPLERRRTYVIDASTVPRITVCIESPDQSYTGERLAPFANERSWREHIERWTGIAWRGDVQIGRECSTALWSKIEVREATPEDDSPENTLAWVNTSRPGTRWMRTEILWVGENLQRVDDYQAEWGLVHEIGHALGLWHVEPGSGFVMEPRNPRTRRQMPAKERDLAQLAYEVGPGARYPGLEDTTPVPALPFLDGLLRWLMR